MTNFTKANANASFSGPLEFLNTYQYQQTEGYLTGLGSETEYASGVSFWNSYGRTCKESSLFPQLQMMLNAYLVYNASAGQLQYSPTFDNGKL